MRLSTTEIETIFDGLQLGEPARALIRQIRAGDPARRVNRKINITGRFPSAKMGLTIQYESRSGEGLACLFYESDDEVLEFYDQPYTFRVAYQQPGVTATHIEHTPDFLVIRRKTHDDGSVEHSITFEEWRQNKRMENYATGDPLRWLRLMTGDWTQLPIEEYLRTLALDYRIRLNDTTPTIVAENYELLCDHFLHPQAIEAELLIATRQVIGRTPGISVRAARTALPQLSVDALQGMIAQRKIEGNLRSALLTDHDNFRLYLDAPAMAMLAGAPLLVERGEMAIEAGQRFRMGAADYEILGVTSDKVLYSAARDGRGHEVALADFTRWSEAGDVVGVSDGRQDLAQALLDHDPKLIDLARARLRRIEPYLQGGTRPEARSVRRWITNYKRAEELHGDGFIGLISAAEESGNRDPQLAEETEQRAAKVIKDQLLGPDQRSPSKAYGIYKDECAEVGMHAMARSTFFLRYKILRQSDRLRARVGSKAGNGAAMRSRSGGPALSPHGQRAFARVHIDHTTLDLETVDSVTGANLGRPDCTLVFDAYSRRLLVALALYQKPSANTNMLAVRELVKSYHQLPTTIVVDGGSDFRSAYFESLLSAYKTKLEHRRTGNPRDGGAVESAFKKLDTDVIWMMQANTQIRKKVREMGPENDPSKRAIWTLAALQDQLDRYVELYNNQPLTGVGKSPRELFEASMAAAGPRTFKNIPYTTAFRALTAQQPKHGPTAIVQRDGVRVNNLTYMCDALRMPGIEGSKVKVRYEPLDARVAYVRVNKIWHVCHVQYRDLDGRTEKEVAAASQELRRRLGQEPSMRELAAHLRDMQTREAQLSKEQRLRKRRASEQQAMVVSREPVEDEIAQAATSPTEVESETPVAAAVEIELTGYEAPSDEDFLELLEDTQQKEAA